MRAAVCSSWWPRLGFSPVQLGLAGEQHRLVQGEQVRSHQGELDPDLVDVLMPGGQATQAGVLAGPDPVPDAGMGAGAGFEERQLPTTDLLVGLRDRGLDMTRPILVVLDGSSAMREAVVDVFDHPVITRCQLHNRSFRTSSRSTCGVRSAPRCARPITQTVHCSPKRNCRL